MAEPKNGRYPFRYTAIHKKSLYSQYIPTQKYIPAQLTWSHYFEKVSGKLPWRSIFLFMLPFLFYLSSLAPTIYNLDSAELTTAAATGGLVRATGYPLYLLIGKLWSWIPIGDVGYRMNLLSAACAALTLLLADRILQKLGVGFWGSLGALGLLATGTYFWGLSLVAEVYTLQTAITAGIILSLLLWSQKPSAARLGLVGLSYGLGLAHHAATILLIPAGVFFVSVTSPREAFKTRPLLLFAGGIGLGLSLYLTLSVRYLLQPEFNYAGTYDGSLNFQAVNLMSPQGLLWLISGRAFSGQMFAYSAAELIGETRHFLSALWKAFFAIGIGPGLLGLVIVFRRNWKFAGMLLCMFIFSAGFYINYRVIDKETMYLPAYLIWAIWAGIGFETILVWLSPKSTLTKYPSGSWRVKLGIIAMLIFIAAWNWPIASLAKDWSTRIRGEKILHSVDEGAIVFGWWDTVPAIQYLQFVEDQRSDVLAINRFLISHTDLMAAIAKEVYRRPIYIDSIPGQLPKNLGAEKIGVLYRIYPNQSHLIYLPNTGVDSRLSGH